VSFLSMIPTPPTSTLFPYTTLFRSVDYMVGRVMLHDPADYPIAINESMTPVTYQARSFLSAGLGFFGGGNMAFRRSVLAEIGGRSEEHTSELQSLTNLVCRLLLEKK